MRELFRPICVRNAVTWRAVKDEERDAAVEEHLKALDDELARLKKMEAAMDRRIAEAEEEKRRLEEGPGER
jgi:hypothetical protein